jgi:hypothetical protein
MGQRDELNILHRHSEILVVSTCGFPLVQRKRNTPPMTIVMIRQESNNDLRHDLGHMEYQRVSGTLKPVAGVVLQVIDLHRLSGSCLEFAGSRSVSDNGCCKRSNSARRASRKLVLEHDQWRLILMLFKSEQRGFAVGQEVGSCGRCTRLVLGLLGLVYIGGSVAQMGPSATLLGQIGGSLLLTAILYIALFWVLGASVLSHLHPWILTGIFWAPMLIIPLLLLISWGWGFGMLLYLSVALIVGGADVLRWLRGGGVAQPPLPATLHRLLPAQCHRPDRAPLHDTVNTHEGSGYARGKPEAARSERSMPAAWRSRVNALAVRSPPSTRCRRRSRL